MKVPTLALVLALIAITLGGCRLMTAAEIRRNFLTPDRTPSHLIPMRSRPGSSSSSTATNRSARRTVDGAVLAAELEDALNRGHWSSTSYGEWSKRVEHAPLVRSGSDHARLELALGLLASLCDRDAAAREHFARAKAAGLADARAVCPDRWTPTALQRFADASAQ